ncbi:MAG: phenylacetic acid degradation protein PaaN, partial [Sphingobacteriales bacterium]
MSTTIKDHQTQLLHTAIKALHERTFYAPFPENPSPGTYGENADEEGRMRFEKLLKQPFAGLQQEAEKWVGEEESPFTQQKLGVTYPFLSPAALVKNSSAAFDVWRKVKPLQRAAILIETLEQIRSRFFEIAY